MKKQKLLILIEDVIQKTTDLELSSLLPKVFVIARQLGDKDFEKWLLLETSGYFNTNPALTKEVEVPNYRRIAGQYSDKAGRPIIIEDPKLFQVTNYPIRESVSELEDYLKKDGYLKFRNPYVNELLSKSLGVEIDMFTFNGRSIKPVINEIRNHLLNWLIDKQKELSDSLISTDGIHYVANELSSLHPIVQNAASELYQNGHYRQAILDTYIALVDAVKSKSEKHELDNTPLMQNVFSPRAPIIKVSDDPDEQQGFMWLYCGAVMAIRNPKAHRLIKQTDPQRTLEWLSFASVLLRVLDDSQKMN